MHCETLLKNIALRSMIDLLVVVAMFTALYINWTDFPCQPQVVRGMLIKLEPAE